MLNSMANFEILNEREEHDILNYTENNGRTKLNREFIVECRKRLVKVNRILIR
jgi:hypothetical protein